MTLDQLLDELLEREGWNGPEFLDLHDRGGRTSWGISERAHPEAWKHGPPSKEDARLIYSQEYVLPFDWVQDPLRVQLIDIAVNSGERTAVRLLQRAIGVIDDGIVGPVTRAATKAAGSPRMVNNALVAFRLRFVDDLSDGNPTQKRFEEGWENRALLFLL